MADTDAREIGRVETVDGMLLGVGTDHGVVTLGLPGVRARLEPGAADELAGLIIDAYWQARAVAALDAIVTQVRAEVEADRD